MVRGVYSFQEASEIGKQLVNFIIFIFISSAVLSGALMVQSSCVMSITKYANTSIFICLTNFTELFNVSIRNIFITTLEFLFCT